MDDDASPHRQVMTPLSADTDILSRSRQTMSEQTVVRTRQIGDNARLEVRVDPDLNMVLLLIDVPELSREHLEKIRDQIRTCYGDDFNIVEIDSRPVLAKILLADSSELTRNMLESHLKNIENKLSECGVIKLIEDLSRSSERSRQRSSKSSKSRPSRTR